MADCEISSLVTKFCQLKNAGLNASLHIDCESGKSFATLQVHLPPSPHPPYPYRPHYRRDPHQPHQDDRHQRHHLSRREQPARRRRREERGRVRAAKEAAIDGTAASLPNPPPTPQIHRDLATPPLLPPIARGHPPQSQVQPFVTEQVVDTLDVAAEEAAVAYPVSPSLQVTPHPPSTEHFMGSFCFLAPKDPSLLPLPSSLRVSRAHSPPPSKRILRSTLVRMKKERISQNQMIDKGVKRFYISGVWVGHVCKFVHFVDGGAEPTLNCKDPGPLPPLGPLCSQQVTDLPPHPGPLPAAGEDPGPVPPIGSQKESQLPPHPSPLPAGGLHVDLG